MVEVISVVIAVSANDCSCDEGASRRAVKACPVRLSVCKCKDQHHVSRRKSSPMKRRSIKKER